MTQLSTVWFNIQGARTKKALREENVAEGFGSAYGLAGGQAEGCFVLRR